MALSTPITRGSFSANGSPTTLTVPSFTSASDELIIASVLMFGTGSKVPSSITGHDGGSSWVQVGTVEQAGTRFSISLWASHSAGATGTIVANISGAATASIVVTSITGADVSGTVANSFSGVAGGNGYGTALAPLTGLTGASTTLGFWSVNSSTSLTPESTQLENYLYSYNSRLVATDYNATGDSTPTATSGQSREWGCQTCEIKEGVPALSIDSAPVTMAKAESGVSFVVSTPATVPTTGNTTVINSGDALTVTSVTGSDPYTINCTVPVDITKQAGSYAWTITVDVENVVSSSIPLTAQSGWTSLVLASPLTTSGYMLEGYTGDTPVTGDTMEYETTTNLSPGTNSEWVWDVAPVVDQVVGRRVIQVDGTVGATADITFTVGIGDIPIITLSGDNPETVEAGTSWSEAGYTATDTEDGTITGSVVVAGDTVDPNTLGTYNVTYDVTDSDSNPATQVVRVVNVTDTIKPSVSLIGAAVKEVLLNGTYVELGATASDSFEGDLTGSIVVAGDVVDETTLGTYVLTYDVSDSSANAADQKTRTVNVVAELSVIPAASRTSVFHIAAALRALETYTHTQTNELVVEWLESEGISRSSLNGMLYGYLGSLGYTGSIDDRMKKWSNDA